MRASQPTPPPPHPFDLDVEDSDTFDTFDGRVFGIKGAETDSVDQEETLDNQAPGIKLAESPRRLHGPTRRREPTILPTYVHMPNRIATSKYEPNQTKK